ncbi:DEKNAAC105533 [Brettanomyces naardenensis]|uniref:Eukaryotic translation initiation factor 3 subunit G n=1 Tax=Brettanomyces naardenensis TaxID=13370 RepID=A0A448YTR0_BRENA|nr:DEKNAAC105533 [Brettanomyces naardenensis]
MPPVSASWADADNDLPPTEVIENADGTKTVISYKFDEKHRKVKITQKIKLVKVTENVNPAIAARKKWARFGDEKNNKTVGPDARTTQFGEEVRLLLSTSWKQEEEKEKKEQKKYSKGKVQTIKCRTCGGDHFTSKCPFKDTLGVDMKKEADVVAPGEASAPSGSVAAAAAAAGLGDGRSSYVPPHMRRRLNGEPARPSDQREKEDTTTLRVTNLNEMVNEGMLNSLFSRFGYIQRLTILRNRETRESRGIAFVEMDSVEHARQAIESVNGRGFMNLIISVDFAKPRGER